MEFVSYQNKLLLLKSTKQLKGSNIYITKDLCWEDQQKYKLLRKHKVKAIQKGHTAYIRGNYLVINNVVHNLDDLDEKEEELEDNCVKEKVTSPNTTPKRLTAESSLEEDDTLVQEETINFKNVNKNRSKASGSTADKGKILTRSNFIKKKK